MRKGITHAIGLGIVILAVPLAIMAMWSETLRMNVDVYTGELDWEIVSGSTTYKDACGLQPGYGDHGGNDWNASHLPQPFAEQLDKDVGCTSVSLKDTDGDGDYDALEVTLHNVYPWYYTHIAFKVHNDGTIPLKIWKIIIDNTTYYELNEQELQQGVEMDLTGDGKPDILIWWGDNFGVQLHPCESADISFDVTVLQDAPEGATLKFTVTFDAIQWNEYEAQTPSR